MHNDVQASVWFVLYDICLLQLHRSGVFVWNKADSGLTSYRTSKRYFSGLPLDVRAYVTGGQS